MFLKTHSFESFKDIAVDTVAEGDIIMFRDASAAKDAPEQLGYVYRRAPGLCFAVLPLNAVSPGEYAETQESDDPKIRNKFREDPARRFVLQPKSAELSSLGVIMHHYYTIGLSLRK